jgi:adenosylcobinamide amidohydrolase
MAGHPAPPGGAFQGAPRAAVGPLASQAPTLRPGWLVVRLPGPHAVISWAVVNGGRRTAELVAWHQVRNAELQPHVDPARLLADRLAAEGLAGAVGLLTSARLELHADEARECEGVAARCVATVGLGNARGRGGRARRRGARGGGLEAVQP